MALTIPKMLEKVKEVDRENLAYLDDFTTIEGMNKFYSEKSDNYIKSVYLDYYGTGEKNEN